MGCDLQLLTRTNPALINDKGLVGSLTPPQMNAPLINAHPTMTNLKLLEDLLHLKYVFSVSILLTTDWTMLTTDSKVQCTLCLHASPQNIDISFINIIHIFIFCITEKIKS